MKPPIVIGVALGIVILAAGLLAPLFQSSARKKAVEAQQKAALAERELDRYSVALRRSGELAAPAAMKTKEAELKSAIQAASEPLKATSEQYAVIEDLHILRAGPQVVYKAHHGAANEVDLGVQSASSEVVVQTCQRRDDLVSVNGFDEEYSGWGIGEDSDVGTRLYHLGCRRKFVHAHAIVFHLNHPMAPRDHVATSHARLEETIRSGKVRCARGLDQYLPRSQSL